MKDNMTFFMEDKTYNEYCHQRYNNNFNSSELNFTGNKLFPESSKEEKTDEKYEYYLKT